MSTVNDVTTAPSVWTAPAASGARGPRLADWLLVAAAACAAVGQAVWEGAPGGAPVLSWSLVLTLLVLPGLPWRRTRPLAVVIASTALASALQLAGALAGIAISAYGAVIVMMLMPYALFRWGSGRDRVIGAIALGAGTVVSTIAGLIPGSRFEVVDGTAHLCAYEAPDVVNDLILDFLATHR